MANWRFFDKTGFGVDYKYLVSAGSLGGFTPLTIYGRNNALGTIRGAVWGGGNNVLTWPSVVEGYRVATPDVTATHSLRFNFLDSNYATQTVTATLTGSTPVSLGTYIRCNGFEVIEPGRTAGNVIDYIDVFGSGAVTGGTVSAITMLRGRLIDPFNRSQDGFYTIPANQNFLAYGMWGCMNIPSGVTAAGVDIELWYGQVGYPLQNYITLGIQNLGNSVVDMPFRVPVNIGSKTDIEIRGLCNTTGKDVSCGLYGILISI